MSKIAILGGNGLVGNYLYQFLSNKHTVYSLTREQLDLINFQAVSNYFKNNSYDVVINCAINSDSKMTALTDVATDNLTIFSNIYSCRSYFGKVLQICSGAEFDRRKSLSIVNENELLSSYPVDPYGLSKNTCARISYFTEGFYNLRLFGVFYSKEHPRRLLPKILSNQQIYIEDKYFDYLYLEDLLPVVEYYIKKSTPKFKDVNIVYTEKILLSDFVKKFCKKHNLPENNITYGKFCDHNYTGNSKKFDELDLPRLGLDTGIERYK